MYYVYLIKSQKNDKLYFGFTTDLKKRLHEHNEGLSKSTKPYAPWELIYYEAYKSRVMAEGREKNLKYFGIRSIKKKNRPLGQKGAGDEKSKSK